MPQEQVNGGAAQVQPPNWTWSRISFVLFMLALTALFVALGTWQMNRLGEKERAIALVEERIGADPIPLPPLGEWVGFDPDTFDYRPVTLTGTFANDQTVRVFTALADARGTFSGPGYWIMTPFFLEEGGMVWVNRGFVPEMSADAFAAGGASIQVLTTINGVGRQSEEPNAFTPGPDIAERIEWVRNVDRLNALLENAPDQILPITIDQAAGEEGALPQGGETKLTFSNRHFEYALTWYGLAILTPLMLLVWWRRGTAG